MRKLQRMLVRRVRGKPAGVKLAFRCDGPEVRRELNIRIFPSSSRRLVVFSTRARSEERREPQALLDRSAARGEDTIEMCGWCDRFLVAGEWVEVEEAAARLQLFRRSDVPKISHAVCPRCSAGLLAA
jgi:hypothetical protein